MFYSFRDDGAGCYSILWEANIFTALDKIQKTLSCYDTCPYKDVCHASLPVETCGDMPPRRVCQTPGFPIIVKDEFPALLQSSKSSDTKQDSYWNSADTNGYENTKKGNNSHRRAAVDFFASGSLQENLLPDVFNEHKTNTTESPECGQTDTQQDFGQTNFHSANITDAPKSILLKVLTAGKENAMKDSQSKRAGLPSTDPVINTKRACNIVRDHQKETDQALKDDPDLIDRDMTSKSNIDVKINIKKSRKGNKHQGKRHCARCNLSFDLHSDYRKHYSNIHRVKTCQLCSKVLKGKAEISRHQEKHSKSRRAHSKANGKDVGPSECVCSICGQKCQGKWNLQLHMYKTHDHIEQGLHHCRECKLIFNSKIRFEKHLACCKSSNFECKNCLQKFSDYSSLKKHQGSHTCLSFICNLCGYKTREKRYLQKHLMTKHNQVEDGIFYCDICKKPFTFKKWYENHMECHRNSSFKCTHCTQTFVDYNKLLSHKNLHFWHKRRSCQECSLVFKTDHELKVCNKIECRLIYLILYIPL